MTSNILRFAVLTLLLNSSLGNAKDIKVDCDKGGTISEIFEKTGLGAIKPGDVLKVSGTCVENVIIRSNISQVTIDGQGKTVLTAANRNQDAILLIGASEILITGLKITNAVSAVSVARHSVAFIFGNIFEGLDFGLIISSASFAAIGNNLIQNNLLGGILVNENSEVRIGYFSTGQTAASPNKILNNGGPGIQLYRAASAGIVGNEISNNAGAGIKLFNMSFAGIAANIINANNGGIVLSNSSGVDLAEEFGIGFGPALFRRPNQSTQINNGFGLSCQVGGHIAGNLGTLNGASGIKQITTGCIDATSLM